MSSHVSQKIVRKPRKKPYASTPKSAQDTQVSEAQPVHLLNDLNTNKPVLTKDLYLYAQQFFFHDEPNEELKIENRLISIKQTRNSELIIATDHGQIGILERNEYEANWSTIYRVYSEVSELNPTDALYIQDKKLLIDLCVDNESHLLLLTKIYSSEFFIEVYDFNEITREILLVNMVRLYYDNSTNMIVLIDESNSKIYWCNPITFKAKKSLSSSESISAPNSIAFIENFGFYLSSQKGIIIRQKEKEAVLHQVPNQSYPLDMCYSSQDEAVYFVDKFNLYRSRFGRTAPNSNLFRYKKILCNNESIVNNTGFTRVLRVRDWFYLMIRDENSLISINASELI